MRRVPARQMIVGLALTATIVVLLRIAGVHMFSVLFSGELFRPILALGKLRPEAVLIAFSLSYFSMLISGAIWTRLLLRLGHSLPFHVGLAAYLSAGIAGYVVNAAGPVLGSAVCLRRHGVCAGRAALLTLTANALGFCGVLVWAPLGLLILSRTGMDTALPVLGRHGPTAALLALIGLAVGLVVILRALTVAPHAHGRLARRLLGATPLASNGDRDHDLTLRQALALVPWSAGATFAGMLSLYVALGALNPSRDINLGDVVGSVAIAATIGSLAFFVPDGMGVRDGALVALLTHSTGLPMAQCAAAAIVVRAMDPITKLSMLFVLPIAIKLGLGRFISHSRTTLRARWSQRPTHPTLRLPWYLWQAAFAERE